MIQKKARSRLCVRVCPVAILMLDKDDRDLSAGKDRKEEAEAVRSGRCLFCNGGLVAG
jgi:formate hydrogenlyase subunit 6/NADH:ubiquinone oxidoreductase subunit I